MYLCVDISPGSSLNPAHLMTKRALLLLGAGASLASAEPSAPAFDQGPVFTVVEENDLVVRTDRHYTQGLKISYFHRDDDLPLGTRRLYDRIPEAGFESVVGRFGYSVGQNIYTPAETDLPTIQRDDRPYAGWLYISAILQRRGWSLGDRLTQEDFELEAGVIGEWALAEEAQDWIHELRGFSTPRGWDHQLRNEPGLRLKYSRAIRFPLVSSERVGIDLTPRTGISLGNVDTSGRLGAVLRVGVNLPDDFGYHTIDSLATTSGGLSCSRPQQWSAYLFAGAEGRVVLYNQFLDGTLFHDSHSVDKRWVVGDFVGGFVVGLNHFELGYAHTFRSREFHTQTERNSFGSIFFKARF